MTRSLLATTPLTAELESVGRELADNLLQTMKHWSIKPEPLKFSSHHLPDLPKILTLSPDQFRAMVLHGCHLYAAEHRKCPGGALHAALAGVLRLWFRMRQSQEDELLCAAIQTLEPVLDLQEAESLSLVRSLTGALEQHGHLAGMTQELLEQVAVLVTCVRSGIRQYGASVVLSRLEVLAMMTPVKRAIIQPGVTVVPIAAKPPQNAVVDMGAFWARYTDEGWGGWIRTIETLRDQIAMMPKAQADAWNAVWCHAAAAKGSNPAKGWLKPVEGLVQALGTDFSPRAAQWLRMIFDDLPRDESVFDERCTTLMKGFLWICSFGDVNGLASVIGDLVRFGYGKAYGVGARAPAVANAGLFALGRMGKSGVVQLTRLQSQVKYNAGARQIEKALQQAAELLRIGREEVEELSVLDYGLNARAKRVFSLPAHRAEMQLTGASGVTVSWFDETGKALKAQPAAAKKADPVTCAEIEKISKEVTECLTGQARRLEGLFLGERHWPLSDWLERYQVHPLLGWLAGRLIWQFSVPAESRVYSGMSLEGILVDSTGQALPDLPADTQVRLWHPIQATLEEVQQWRTLLLGRQIVQPFKQAFREVYLLTPAEEETSPLSRRFAGHLLRQHQLAALCRERGWAYRLQGDWDGANSPARFLTQHNIGIVLELDTDLNGVAFTESTVVYSHVSTGDLHFYTREQRNLPLAQVPALIFSELLRDIDLFVGVCSIGINPSPADIAQATPAGDYLRASLTSELNASAQIRRDALTAILSRLTIAPRCRIEGKYLIVQGELRIYSIHLGSANILMSPNNQYLCIIPDKRSHHATQGLYLPFEGDQMLSLILSKALLLASDRAIDDTSIVAQINRGL